MLSALGNLVVRHRRLTLAAGVLVLVLTGLYGGGVARNLIAGGFEDGRSEAGRAEALLTEQFGQHSANVVVVVTAVDGDIDSPASSAAGTAVTRFIGDQPHVTQSFSYWTLGGPPPLRSDGGDRGLLLAFIEGNETEVMERTGELLAALDVDNPGGDAVELAAGGVAVVNQAINRTTERDLLRAEMIAIPITLVLLVWVFGSVVAALLPLLIGVFSIIATFAILQLLSGFTDVSIFALNAATALGLGLSIDYSLFVISRYREELLAGRDPATAIRRTVQTAGRTVLFSAATVAISLSAMLVFPLAFMRSFAYAGFAVAITAALGAVVLLPALLAVLGHRVEKWQVFRRKPVIAGEGIWHRVAMFVMRRPLPIATAAVALLVLLGAPFLGIRLGIPDDRVLGDGSDVRAAHDIMRDEFSPGEAATLDVVLPGMPGGTSAELEEYAARLSALPGAERVDSLAGSFVGGDLVGEPGITALRFAATDGAWLTVVPAVEPLSPDGEALVEAVRGTPAPSDEVYVGGQPARLVDAKEMVFGRLPWALAFVAVATFVLLFLLFGSLLVPAKALVLNLLSLSATFGAMVWIFQEGNLSGVLGFTATGEITVVMPILMFCIAFGLSMDYEVFLLSRIKEEHDNGADTQASVAMGLERTGRLITAAAVLIAVVFVAFATAEVSFMKMFGVGLTLAVLVDAFIIRAALVPAFMRLAGNANWWAPGPLRRFHARFGLREHVELDEHGGRQGSDGPAREDDRMETVAP